MAQYKGLLRRVPWPKGRDTGRTIPPPTWMADALPFAVAHNHAVDGKGAQVQVELIPLDEFRMTGETAKRLRMGRDMIPVYAVMGGVDGNFSDPSSLRPYPAKVAPYGAIRVAPAEGNMLFSQEGTNLGAGTVTIVFGQRPATSFFVANDDPAASIRFSPAIKLKGDQITPNYGGAPVCTLPAGSPPASIDATAYGIKIIGTGGTGNWRCWWIV